MYYGDAKYYINDDAMLIALKPRKVIIKCRARSLLNKLDDPIIQLALKGKTAYIKYKGRTIYLRDLYKVASDRGYKSYRDIPVAVLASF